MESKLSELQAQYPGSSLLFIGDKVLIGCFPEIRIQEELRWPVLIVCIGNNCQYVMKLAEENSIEPLIYKQLENSNLSPRLINMNKCLVYDLFDSSSSYFTVFITEKYDADLSSLLEKVTDKSKVEAIILDIIHKSLELNINHRIRHGDFHPGNIVYRGSQLRFIDFELSTIYDSSYQPIQTGVQITDPTFNYYRFNKYYDLLALEWNIPKWNVEFVIPQEYRDHYMSTLTEADIEMMDEVKEMNLEYPKLTFIFS